MKSRSAVANTGYLHSLRLERDRVPAFDRYPFSIPAITRDFLANRESFFKHLFARDES